LLQRTEVAVLVTQLHTQQRIAQRKCQRRGHQHTELHLRSDIDESVVAKLVLRTSRAGRSGRDEIAGQKVHGISHRLCQPEIRRVHRRHAATADRATAITQCVAALDLEIRPLRRIIGIQEKGYETGGNAAGAGPAFDHQV
jgi:hypothetical protein